MNLRNPAGRFAMPSAAYSDGGCHIEERRFGTAKRLPRRRHRGNRQGRSGAVRSITSVGCAHSVAGAVDARRATISADRYNGERNSLLRWSSRHALCEARE